jgi:zinc protease
MRMRTIIIPLAGLVLAGCATTKRADVAATMDESVEVNEELEAALPVIDLPYTKFVLDNGLRVIVHEDRKAPVVAVNVWYHVGSKDERPGRTGFAHLFEHLMFQGSENAPGEFFEPLEAVGATDMNGTTSRDRTNYFQTVPTPALDVALFMESDRMGHFRSAITRERLDEQREVVKNEKRQQVINRPYGRVRLVAAEMSYPVGHPYSWSTIGRMADLDAASLEDVKEWFDTYYGAANAVVTIVGDISAAEARERVEKYFGHIAPGPSVPRPGVWVAPMSEHRRHKMHDNVSHARVYRIYNVPAFGEESLEQLRLAALVLGSGKTSRLHRRLVHEDQIATDASAWISDGEIGSQLWIAATAKSGVELSKVEAVLDEELQRFLESGPTAQELRRARTRYFASLVGRLEKVGGWGKADYLAMHEVFGGNPSSYRRLLDYFKNASAPQVKSVAHQWLTPGSLTIEVHPELSYAAASQAGADRRMPQPEGSAELVVPALQRATLSNGIEVVLKARHDVPIINLQMMFNGGYAADRWAGPGAMNLLGAMLTEGTKTRTSMEISEALEDLGASVSVGSSLDTTSISLAAMTPVFGEVLDIFADVVLNPTIPEADLERVRRLTLAGIEREKNVPFSMGLRLMGPLVFGQEHPYGMPLTGSGTAEFVSSIDREQLLAMHGKIFVPANGRIIVAGDITLEALVEQLEARLGGWQADGARVETMVPAVAPRERPEVVIIDRPGAVQSFIIGGHVVAPFTQLDEARAALFNDIFGGAFTGRINMNLREEKGWSYGARSTIWRTMGQQLFMTYAGVQADRTADSMLEMRRELREILSERPPTDTELSHMRARRVLSIPGRNETVSNLLSSAAEIVKFGLADDYVTDYARRVRETELDGLMQIAAEVVQPERTLWIIVGDRTKIEGPVRALDFGEVRIFDQDLNPL